MIMPQESLLIEALMHLWNTIDTNLNAEEALGDPRVLLLKGSPERKAFTDEFVQCFEANEDLFLEIDRLYRLPVILYWYYLARTSGRAGCLALPKSTGENQGPPNISWYVISYALRQGQIVPKERNAS